MVFIISIYICRSFPYYYAKLKKCSFAQRKVYKEFGLSGKGIRVVVLDDGLEYSHPDISANYVS
jgi:hypothetical protein